ncbi:MAG TPA: hypothetical protein VN721_12015, partial [Flavipsychrobacter sp.]|nr:hypothetical protein [Flavipsychrobacter sp.]
MKRFFLTGILLLGIAQMVSYAQTDDIYSNGSDQQNSGSNRGSNNSNYNNNQNYNNQNNNNQNYNNQQTYQSPYQDNNANNGNYNNNNYSNNNNSNNNSDEYVDYNDDNSYSTRIRRFDDPFYNQGYYSSFYNPYWYSPNYVDPYMGWNPWYGPSFGVGIGIGGPYWSSYWGWNTWWGYPGFGSCWGYPLYASPWYGGFYGGFWNGYYAGIYNGYGGYTGRSVSYGPRYTLNNRYSGIGYRSALGYGNNAGPRPFNYSRPVSSLPGRTVGNTSVNSLNNRPYSTNARPTYQNGMSQERTQAQRFENNNVYSNNRVYNNSRPVQAERMNNNPSYGRMNAAPSQRFSGPQQAAPRMAAP